MSFYIKDFAVLPGYQGKGVGQMLLMELQQYLLEHKPADWAVSLELISTKEAVEFYKKHGFEERPCEWDGPGMLKMIRNKVFNGGVAMTRLYIVEGLPCSGKSTTAKHIADL